MTNKVITAQELLSICESAGSLYVVTDQLSDPNASPYSGGPKNWTYDDEGRKLHVKPCGTTIDLNTGEVVPTEAERLEMQRHTDRLPSQDLDDDTV